MGNPFVRKKEHELSQAAASQMLSNIFDACEFEANQVPMDVLVSYTRYRRERHYLRWCVLGLLVLFLLVPLLFVTPELTITPEGEPGRPVLRIETKAFLPIERVSAAVGGYNLPVYEMGAGEYQVIPDRNGVVKIKVELKNHQYTQEEIWVENVDVTPPELLGSKRRGDYLELKLQDNGKIDFEGIYALTGRGKKVFPVSYSEAKGTVAFAYPQDAMNIFIPDEYANVLQLVLTLS